MEQDTGAASRSWQLRPLNEPVAVGVQTATDGTPAAVLLGRRRRRVEAVRETWRVDEGWWRPRPVSRLYFDLVLEGGRRLVVYNDLVEGGWYRQGY